ncbi:phenylalanyl-tRNA synthetase subunit beta [Palleronia abyssalis]|uniref:Phenylalanyl-tRNA synthetase subunit beta n=1 Tax=Palleronia abyssalis TaxID=1501240 RepID=A0A2R8BTS5_9RHOB|nr:phenylalanyl-tRNA synthetase subunit beta [Palleronia abyssalis]SPJ23533.1 hypothetical protein PAA8504_01345 [Palleronia abyssalis]
MRIAKILFILFTACLVIAGHVGLWRSDAPDELKMKLTVLNALGWAIVILPAFAVARWAAMKRPSADQSSQSPK